MRRYSTFLQFLILVPVLAMLVGRAAAFGGRIDTRPAPPVPNADFRQGDKTPTGWTLSGGKGQWVDRHILEVTGRGQDDNQWRCKYPFVPGRLYRFEIRDRPARPGQRLRPIMGPTLPTTSSRRRPIGDGSAMCFGMPDNGANEPIHLGQWRIEGSIQYDAVRLIPVVPVHRDVGRLQLGDGESIRDGHYTFAGLFCARGHQFSSPAAQLDRRTEHRPLVLRRSGK